MATLLLTVLLVGADAKPVAVSPRPSPAEFGYGLRERDAPYGWISLFDGETTFGWEGATVKDGLLSGGKTTTSLGSGLNLRAKVVHGGKLIFGGREIDVKQGRYGVGMGVKSDSPIELGKGLVLEQLAVRPIELKPVFNGKDLSNWKIIRHPSRPDDQQAKWEVEDGTIHAVGGPGALELDRLLDDFILQIDVRTRRPLANGGVFVRSIPGDFMNGYEAQVFNACYDGDPSKPARWSTGAIDDRQMARRLVSRDGQTFTMTVIADGPHIATWVNGYQMTDWTDDRPPHDNPRQGKRLEPGTLQLQAHDPDTDVEFSNIRIRELKSNKRQ